MVGASVMCVASWNTLSDYAVAVTEDADVRLGFRYACCQGDFIAPQGEPLFTVQGCSRECLLHLVEFILPILHAEDQVADVFLVGHACPTGSSSSRSR